MGELIPISEMKRRTPTVSELPQMSGGVVPFSAVKGEAREVSKPKGRTVLLTEDLKGLKIKETGEVIRRDDFTPEMKSVHQNLLKQLMSAQQEQKEAIGPTSFFGQIKSIGKTIGGSLGDSIGFITDPDAWKYLPGELKETATKYPTVGRELATGLGYTLESKYIKDLSQRSEGLKTLTQETLIKEYRDAIVTGDQKKKERLEKVMEQDDLAPVSAQIWEEAPTTQQVIGSAAELALLAALGYKPYLRTGRFFGPKGAQIAKELAIAGKVIKTGRGAKAISLTKTTLREAGIGAGFFGAMEARDRDATINDIVRMSEIGALVGGGAVLSFAGMGAGLGAAGRKLGPPISRRWNETVKWLEKAATREPTAVGKPGKVIEMPSQLQKTLSYIGEKPITKAMGVKQRIGKVGLGIVTQARKFAGRGTDRFAAGKRIEKRIGEMVNRPLKENEKVYRDWRLLGSTADAKAEKMIIGYQDDLLKYEDKVRQKAFAWMTQLDLIDRAKLGQTVVGRQSLDDLVKGLVGLQKEIGAKDMLKVRELRQLTKQFQDDLLLMRRDAGLISDGTIQVLRKTHPNYVPHKVIMDFEERAVQGLSQSLNVPKTDIMKAVGSAKQIEHPAIAIANRTRIATQTIEKNKSLVNFVKAQEKYNIFPGMRPLQTAEQVLQKQTNIRKMAQLKADIKFLLRNKKQVQKLTKTELAKVRVAEQKLNKLSSEAIENLRYIDPDAMAGLQAELAPTEKLSLAIMDSFRAGKLGAKGWNQWFNKYKATGKWDDFISELNSLNARVEDVSRNKKMLWGWTKELEAASKLAGEETINLFRQGVKETWVVPGDIAVAIKNIDAPTMPKIFELATLPQKLLKKFATQFNLSFALPNVARDRQTAALTARGFIEQMGKKYGFAKKGITVDTAKVKALYKQSGGYGSSIFREGDTKVLTALEKRGMTKLLDSKVNPAKTIESMNEFMEQSTRLNVFKSALARGLNPRDAAFVSRDATIDFAKMGTWMRWANKAIPFLNARVQGFINLPRALVSSPEAFARMQMYTAVYPTMLLHAHNRRYESYKNISQYFKNRYWVIMTNETDALDRYTGEKIKVPQFITLPKGEGQTLVSGPIQYYLEQMDGTDYRTTSEMLADTLGSASPMEFQSFDQTNWLASAGSQFGPLATTYIGTAFNVHPYFGYNIIPEDRLEAAPEVQYRRSTPETTKELARIMREKTPIDIPPAHIDLFISSFGGVPKDIQNLAEITYGVIKEGKMGGYSVTETPAGKATRIPIARRFIREATEFRAPEREFQFEKKGEIQEEIATRKIKLKDRAIEILEEMNRMETTEERENYLNSLGDEMTKDIIKKIYDLKLSRQIWEVLKKTDSTELRAKYILWRLKEMEEKGISRKDRLEFLQEGVDKKILTNQVKMWMKALSQ